MAQNERDHTPAESLALNFSAYADGIAIKAGLFHGAAGWNGPGTDWGCALQHQRMGTKLLQSHPGSWAAIALLSLDGSER